MTGVTPANQPDLSRGGDGEAGGYWSPRRERLAVWSGAILALSYPLLALSTGTRAGYQLFVKEDSGTLVGPLTTALAAVCYLTATIGFAVRRRWAWRLSVVVLSFELLMAILVGTVSVGAPERIGSSVWRLYGVDYGFFPLIQPFLGLLWLLWPLTMARYRVRQPAEQAADHRS